MKMNSRCPTCGCHCDVKVIPQGRNKTERFVKVVLDYDCPSHHSTIAKFTYEGWKKILKKVELWNRQVYGR